MGHRLSKIYTRTGDQGVTGLSDGSRIEKDDVRIETIGAVDELNSVLGMVLSMPLPAQTRDRLLTIQHWLFDLGGELSLPGHKLLTDSQVTTLEQWLDHWNEGLPPLKEFILPGGTQQAAALHLARSVCRRVERRLQTLATRQAVETTNLCFINRLSDLLFVCARHVNQDAGAEDVSWLHSRS